jgi:hypothetical protein
LGEFSPIGRFFTLARLLKVTEVTHIFLQLQNAMRFFRRKKGLGCIVGDFFQTHLVTLYAAEIQARLNPSNQICTLIM